MFEKIVLEEEDLCAIALNKGMFIGIAYKDYSNILENADLIADSVSQISKLEPEFYIEIEYLIFSENFKVIKMLRCENGKEKNN